MDARDFIDGSIGCIYGLVAGFVMLVFFAISKLVWLAIMPTIVDHTKDTSAIIVFLVLCCIIGAFINWSVNFGHFSEDEED